MLVLIRGAGDIATGIALRLWRSHIQVIMTDLAQPTAIRRTVAFSQAILAGDGIEVEGVTGAPADTPSTHGNCWRRNHSGTSRQRAGASPYFDRMRL